MNSVHEPGSRTMSKNRLRNNTESNQIKNRPSAPSAQPVASRPRAYHPLRPSRTPRASAPPSRALRAPREPCAPTAPSAVSWPCVATQSAAHCSSCHNTNLFFFVLRYKFFPSQPSCHNTLDCIAIQSQPV